jgi:hypothetical protein
MRGMHCPLRNPQNQSKKPDNLSKLNALEKIACLTES